MGNHAKLRAHVPETCKAIDLAIEHVSSALEYLTPGPLPVDPLEAIDGARELLYEVKPLLNKLRHDNTLLRAIACQEMGIADELQKQLGSYQSFNQSTQTEDL